MANVSELNIKQALEAKSKAGLSILLNNPCSKLVFPKFNNPQLSIVMLTYNKAEYTFRCLESILAYADVDYELIIVDNASTDLTRSMLAQTKNVKCILNDVNQYYSRGNNQGVSEANAPYVLLLNNDIELTPHSLSTLLDTIKQHPKCGAVGAKLIWPDGKLQEAGSMIFQDAGCLGYGRGESPFLPEYSYVRSVDYCSGACLLINKELYLQVGGLDTAWEPAYYEDTDLCIKIRQAGYSIIFQPAAIIFHHEYSSSSPEAAEKLMQINCHKFYQKWRELLKDHLTNNPRNVITARDSNRKQPILIIDDQVPAKDDGRGYFRAYEMLSTLAKDYSITFFAKQNITSIQPALYQLQQMGIEVIYDVKDFDVFLSKRRDHYSLVIVSRPHNFLETKHAINNYLPHAKIIYDAEALFFKRAVIRNKILGINDESATNKEKTSELELIQAADHVIVVSEKERQTILDELPLFTRTIITWGLPLGTAPTKTPFHTRKDILFVGAFVSEGSPNEDAIVYFVKNIFPLIKAKTDCKLMIAGKYPTQNVLSLASESIQVLGYVPDLDIYYENCRLFIIPHRFAGGIPIKLLEAMSRGLPSVVSPLIAEQLSLNNGEVLIGNTPEEFAIAVEKAYKNDNVWNQMREKSLEFIRSTHEPDTLRQQLRQSVSLIINAEKQSQTVVVE